MPSISHLHVKYQICVYSVDLYRYHMVKLPNCFKIILFFDLLAYMLVILLLDLYLDLLSVVSWFLKFEALSINISNFRYTCCRRLSTYLSNYGQSSLKSRRGLIRYNNGVFQKPHVRISGSWWLIHITYIKYQHFSGQKMKERNLLLVLLPTV